MELPPDSLGPILPRVSNGFHLEERRAEREGSVLVVCDYCDEFQMVDNPKVAFR